MKTGIAKIIEAASQVWRNTRDLVGEENLPPDVKALGEAIRNYEQSKFRIVSHQYGVPMWASGRGNRADFTTNPEFAYVYESGREANLKYWRAIAEIRGHDPQALQTEEYP